MLNKNVGWCQKYLEYIQIEREYLSIVSSFMLEALLLMLEWAEWAILLMLEWQDRLCCQSILI